MQQFGTIGLSVVGKNLALNIKNHGCSVSGFSIDKPEVDTLAKYKDEDLRPTYTWEEFVNSLEGPRRILVQVMAGRLIDETLQKLLPLLDKGDIVVNSGNSNFHDTNRRYKEMEEHDTHFIGMGVSGGEEGALNGPALMPGGDERAYEEVSPILEAMTARTPTGQPCVGYIGPAGSGHYVKMVRSGIEYGTIQITSEAYDVLCTVGHYSNDEISEIFKNWDKGALQAYLIEITAEVLKQKDNLTDNHAIDRILNETPYKGTGNWMPKGAVRLGTLVTVIAEAVLACSMSKVASRDDPEPKINSEKAPKDLVDRLAKALCLAMTVSYGQRFEQLTVAVKTYNWHLHYSTVAQSWETGCIIHSQMLHDTKFAYNADKDLPSLFRVPFFGKVRKEDISALREVVKIATGAGIPTPTLNAALNCLESTFNPRLPQSIIQGQRDYFGAHTYQGNDRPDTFHTEWHEEK